MKIACFVRERNVTKYVMEHIVQFGINIDDSAIQKMILEKASETVVKEIKSELGIIDGRWNQEESKIRKMVNDRVDQQMEKYKDLIIESTAKLLTEKLARTKAVKEKTQQILDDVLGE